jgi:hypothetical protein
MPLRRCQTSNSQCGGQGFDPLCSTISLGQQFSTIVWPSTPFYTHPQQPQVNHGISGRILLAHVVAARAMRGHDMNSLHCSITLATEHSSILIDNELSATLSVVLNFARFSVTTRLREMSIRFMPIFYIDYMFR